MDRTGQGLGRGSFGHHTYIYICIYVNFFIFWKIIFYGLRILDLYLYMYYSLVALKEVSKMPRPAVNLVGQQFGQLLVLSESSERKATKVMWLCQCSCGKTVLVRTADLNSGQTKLCGCDKKNPQQKEISKLYSIFQGMKDRCYKPKDKNFHNYGGRGISICDDWMRSSKSFVDWALTNGYSPELQIDRIDNEDNYYPENCRWVTNKENSRNTRYNVVYDGKCIAEWAEEFGIPDGTLRKRLQDYGWSLEKAVTTPIREKVSRLYESKNLRQWSRELNISYITLYNRIYISGWTIEKAVTTPVKK